MGTASTPVGPDSSYVDLEVHWSCACTDLTFPLGNMMTAASKPLLSLARVSPTEPLLQLEAPQEGSVPGQAGRTSWRFLTVVCAVLPLSVISRDVGGCSLLCSGEQCFRSTGSGIHPVIPACLGMSLSSSCSHSGNTGDCCLCTDLDPTLCFSARCR